LYIKDGNKNRLREQDIHKIVDTFNNRIETPKYSRIIPVSEIADPKNDYNLNIPRYVDTFEEEEPVDLNQVAAELKSLDQEMKAIDTEIARYCAELGISTPF